MTDPQPAGALTSEERDSLFYCPSCGDLWDAHFEDGCAIRECVCATADCPHYCTCSRNDGRVEAVLAILAARSTAPAGETSVEWGVRGVKAETDPLKVWVYGSETAARLTARSRTYGGTLVNRVIQYGEWREIPDAATEAGEPGG